MSLPSYRHTRFWLALLAGVICAGCNSSENSPETAADDIVEVQFPDEPLDDSPTHATTPALENRVEETSPLQPGESFPLVSRLEDELEQQTSQGAVVSRSTLEVSCVVTFLGNGAETGTTPQFQVRFGRVRHTREISGQPTVKFDSHGESSGPADDLLGIAGLSGEGFRYRYSQRLGVLGSEDFGEFVTHSADAGTAAGQISEATTDAHSQLRSQWGLRGTTETLRDLLGLTWLRSKRPGERWTEKRLLLTGVPLRQESDFVLLQQRGDLAGIEWESRMTPVTGPKESQDRHLSVALVSGDGTGSAWIDRRTGLPQIFEQTQRLEMQVRTASGSEFLQTKTSMLRIERDDRDTADSKSVVRAGYQSLEAGSRPATQRQGSGSRHQPSQPISRPSGQGPKQRPQTQRGS
ncbi:MAG: hypothetical protein EHM42_00485 [Planctomycetaceae bacterium]|nr:MAG: hypothetical protein EHM42_00485 [Planctomycetaceae bacterium]